MMYERVIEKELSFGDAINALKKGKKVTRAIWGGYWFLSNKPYLNETKDEGYKTSFYLGPTIFAVLKDMGGVAPAQAYQSDMLADDWMVVE